MDIGRRDDDFAVKPNRKREREREREHRTRRDVVERASVFVRRRGRDLSMRSPAALPPPTHAPI